MKRCVSLLLGLMFGLWMVEASAADPMPKLARGAEFRKIWHAKVGATFDQRPLRTVMVQLCSDRQLAWILDRRLDPDQGVSCSLPAAPLSELLPELLAAIGADAVVVGDTIVVGPREATRWLRTLVEIQRKDLSAKAGDVQLVQFLSRPTEWHWDDLEEPQLLAERIARKGKISIKGIESLPYDLWSQGELMGMTPGESLTVIAWQYDQRLVWEKGGHAEFAALQLPVAVTRSFPIPEARREAARAEFSELAWLPKGKSLEASGRVEDLEALEQWIKGSPARHPKPRPPVTDWRDRQFSRLSVANAPLIDVLNSLKAQEIPLVWDQQELTDAGIDLRMKLKLDLQDASIDDLLRAICEPAKLKYQITAEGATISPP